MSRQVEENRQSAGAESWQQFVELLGEAGENILNEFGAVEARERIRSALK